MLRNRWHNASNLGIQVISSHIYREGNCCADKLANMGHSVQGSVWLSSLPAELNVDFFRDRCGLPTTDFHSLLLVVFCLLFFLLRVLA